MKDVIEKFLRYIAIDTQSSETSGEHPSTGKQRDLGRLLRDELVAMGAADVVWDEEHNYVYAAVPATVEADEVLGFISHMDTSPETSGTDVQPKFTEHYDGGDIILGPAVRGSKDKPLVLSPSVYPELSDYVGQTIITTDGATLLGADDKAGVAEIMTMAEVLLEDLKSPEPKYRHGRIAIGFTPDEEIGEGTEFFDLKQFGADVAYTVDGGALGELEYETFNAAAATVTVKGVTVHPGEAKGKMVNAAAIAAQFQCALPADQVPEKTEGREGFYYLCEMEGGTESATLQYIVRDHDRDLFEEKKERLLTLAADLNDRYGDGVVTVELKDQYYNMREKIEPDYLYLVDRAAAAMEALGITPRIQPIRGGTDGAMLSFKGLPCPNLCAGGHNFHGRYEYVPVESMERIVELLLHIACE
ncbi:MAG: peptidase T [Clostridia bacterium]|nr:peptidase T [Clostridia bacterium]MBR1704683.1 peptidase T [Clostridia bacterium]